MSEQKRCEDNCLECKVYNHEKFYCPKWCSVIKNTIADARADEREHILEILHGIDRQIENLVICVLTSECNEQLKEQNK